MKFYFDTEYVNGNYYMCDIFDMSLLSDQTENTCHIYIKQDIPLSDAVVKITKITNQVLNENGVDGFSDAVAAMTRFIKDEIKSLLKDNSTATIDDVIVTFIAHGGFDTDFPYFINNCRKNKVVLDDVYKKVLNQDSMLSFKKHNSTPGLSALARMFNLEQGYQRHSSYGDVWILKKLCDRHTPYISMLTKNYKQICTDIREKMPVDFEEIRFLKREIHQLNPIQYMEDMLRLRTKSKNSSLRNNNLSKICNYFINRKHF